MQTQLRGLRSHYGLMVFRSGIFAPTTASWLKPHTTTPSSQLLLVLVQPPLQVQRPQWQPPPGPACSRQHRMPVQPTLIIIITRPSISSAPSEGTENNKKCTKLHSG